MLFVDQFQAFIFTIENNYVIFTAKPILLEAQINKENISQDINKSESIIINY